MEDLDRAHEFATKVDEPAVWSELANAYLEHAQVGRQVLGVAGLGPRLWMHWRSTGDSGTQHNSQRSKAHFAQSCQPTTSC